MPGASHHVYAFRAGYGKSVIEGMSDDGEPSGTAGPPILAVLRGTDIGDTIIVVTRYFGGTKLGTGGLIRAYSDAARNGLANLSTEANSIRKTLGVDVPYPIYQLVSRLVIQFGGVIEHKTFTTQIKLVIKIPIDNLDKFQQGLTDMTAGKVRLRFLD
jgi:uncharacterized YigZ family protein